MRELRLPSRPSETEQIETKTKNKTKKGIDLQRASRK